MDNFPLGPSHCFEFHSELLLLARQDIWVLEKFRNFKGLTELESCPVQLSPKVLSLDVTQCKVK